MTLRSLFTAGALVSMGVVLSRILGLFREMLLASHFGVGPEADMAVSLLIIPDFITGALVGNAVSVTLVPLFTARDRQGVLQLFWQAMALSIGTFTVLAFVVSLDAGDTVRLIGHGGGVVPGAGVALLIAISTVPLTAATSIFTAYLQYKGRFSVPAFANAIFNGVIVLMLWLLPTKLTVLAASIFAGILIRMLANAYSFYRGDGRFLVHFWQPWQISRRTAKIYATTVATDICNQFPQFAPYYLIALGGAGLAVFNYAFRLSLMPAMIAYNVVQMVFLPWFSRMLRDSGETSAATYSITLQCAWALSLAFCLSFTLSAHEVAQLCFGYGKMDAADIDKIGGLFALGVWGMPAILMSIIWQQVLYAHGKPRMPFVAGVVQAVSVMPLCWIGNRLHGLEGVMVAYAALQVISLTLLSYAAYKQGAISHYRPSAVYGKMAMVAVAFWLPFALLYRSVKLSILFKMLLAIGIGAVVLAAALYMCIPVREWGGSKIGKYVRKI